MGNSCSTEWQRNIQTLCEAGSRDGSWKQGAHGRADGDVVLPCVAVQQDLRAPAFSTIKSPYLRATFFTSDTTQFPVAVIEFTMERLAARHEDMMQLVNASPHSVRAAGAPSRQTAW